MRVVLRHQPAEPTDIELGGQDRHLDVGAAERKQDEAGRWLLAHPPSERVSP